MKKKNCSRMTSSYLNNQNISNNIISRKKNYKYKEKHNFFNKDINDSYSSCDNDINETIDNRINDSFSFSGIEEIPQQNKVIDHLKKYNKEKKNIPNYNKGNNNKIIRFKKQPTNKPKNINLTVKNNNFNRKNSGKIVSLPRKTNQVLSGIKKIPDSLGYNRSISGDKVASRYTQSRFSSYSENNQFNFNNKIGIPGFAMHNSLVNRSINNKNNTVNHYSPIHTAKVVKLKGIENEKNIEIINIPNKKFYNSKGNNNFISLNNFYGNTNTNINPHSRNKISVVNKSNNTKLEVRESKFFNNNLNKNNNNNYDKNNFVNNFMKNKPNNLSSHSDYNSRIYDGNNIINFDSKKINNLIDEMNLKNFQRINHTRLAKSPSKNGNNYLNINNNDINRNRRLSVIYGLSPKRKINLEENNHHLRYNQQFNQIHSTTQTLGRSNSPNITYFKIFPPLIHNMNINNVGINNNINKNDGEVMNHMNRHSLSPNPNMTRHHSYNIMHNQFSNNINIVNNIKSINFENNSNNNTNKKGLLNEMRNINNFNNVNVMKSMEFINNMNNKNNLNNINNFNNNIIKFTNNRKEINNMENLNQINKLNNMNNFNINRINFSNNINGMNVMNNRDNKKVIDNIHNINTINNIDGNNIINDINLINDRKTQIPNNIFSLSIPISNNEINNNLSNISLGNSTPFNIQNQNPLINNISNSPIIKPIENLQRNILQDNYIIQEQNQPINPLLNQEHQKNTFINEIFTEIPFSQKNQGITQIPQNFLTNQNQIFTENQIFDNIQNLNSFNNLENEFNNINIKKEENEKNKEEEIKKEINVTYNSFDASGKMKNYGILTLPGKDTTGNQKTNQDSFVFKTGVNKIKDFNIFGVLDGHGSEGHFVSKFISELIPSKLINHPEIKFLQETEQIYRKLKENNFQIITQSFIEADNQLKNVNFNAYESGCTCVLVIHIGQHIICANTGDSRAIVVYDEKGENNLNHFNIFPLSIDYKPELPEERNRIIMNGGEVIQMKNEEGRGVGPFRVYVRDGNYPGLAMSRSIGDLKGKNIGIIPNPGIIEYNLSEKTKYIVVCSDGIWEFLNNESVADIGKKHYIKNDPSAFCHELINQSLNLWERNDIVVDDITAIVAFF